MTDKAVTISNDHFRPSSFARNLQHSTNPLHPGFNIATVRNRIFVFLVAIAAIVGVVLMLSKIYGPTRTNERLNASNSSNISYSSNQQPLKGTGKQSVTSNASNSSSTTSAGSTSSSSSTSVTVNGQPVAVPQSGSYDKTIKVSGSNVHISGDSSQSTSPGGSVTNSSSTNLDINSE